MTAHERTRSVGVLGGGIAGLAAAIGFRRALPDAEVTVFTGRGEPEYAGAAAPYIHQYHHLVGIDPGLFRRRTGAVTIREAEIRHAGKPSFRLVPLAEMPHVDGAALHQLWLRRAGPDLTWADVARRARRPEDVADGLGVRFDADAYLALLCELAAQVGVTFADAATGEEVGASFDLAIDTNAPGECAGWLQVEGIPGGVHWQAAPGSFGETEILDFSSRQVSWSAGPWHATADIGPEMPPAGRKLAPFDGKILSVGRAALQCESFDGHPLAAALADVTRALELLPRPGASGREAAEYNRRSGMVHDFLLDWAAERWGRPAVVPAGLAALHAQFAHRGRIPFRDEDPVPAGQWIGWLLGRGERPDHIDLTAMALPEARLAATFAGV